MPGPISEFNSSQAMQSPFDMTGKTELNQREQFRASIHKDLDIGAQLPIPLTATYYEGAFFLQDANANVRKDLGAVRWSASVAVQKSDDKKKKGHQLNLLRNSGLDIDKRFKRLDLVGPDPFPPCEHALAVLTFIPDPGVGQANIRTGKINATSVGSPLPAGHPGIILKGSEELAQHIVLHPSWTNVTLAAWRDTEGGPAKFSTRMADISDGAISKTRIASYHTAFKVEGSWKENCGIGLFWGVDRARPDVGRGLFQSDGPLGGNPFTDVTSLGYAGESGGGPVGAGAGHGDKHRIGTTADGQAICQGHLWLGAPWFVDPSRDAPPEVYGERWEKPRDRSGVAWATELRYDPLGDHIGLGGNAAVVAHKGLFRWETFVPIYVPPIRYGDPDNTPPKVGKKGPEVPKVPKPLEPFDIPPIPLPPLPVPPIEGPARNPLLPPGLDPASGVTGPQTAPITPLPFGPGPDIEDPVFPGVGVGEGEFSFPLAPGVGEGAPDQIFSLPQGGSLSRPIRSGVALHKVIEDKTPTAKHCLSTYTYSWMEAGFAARSARPRHSQREDLRYDREPGGPRINRIEAETPVGGRYESQAKEDGGEFVYCQQPCAGRYWTGTVNNTDWLMPPEYDLDYASRGATTPQTYSDTNMGFWDTGIFFGTPDKSTGGGKSAFKVSKDTDGLKFQEYNPAGAATADQYFNLLEGGDINLQANNGVISCLNTSGGSAAVLKLGSSNGTLAAPTNSADDDVLGKVQFNAYDSFSREVGSIRSVVEDIAASAFGLEFHTTDASVDKVAGSFNAVGNLDVYGDVNIGRTGGTVGTGITETAHAGFVTATIQGTSGTLAYLDDITALTVTASSGVFTGVVGAIHLVDTSGGIGTCNLPAASASSGRLIVIKDKGNASSNNITVNRAGSDTIQGATSTAITANYGSVRLRSDGVGIWYLVD